MHPHSIAIYYLKLRWRKPFLDLCNQILLRFKNPISCALQLTQLTLEKTCQSTPTGLLTIPSSWAALTDLQVLCIPGHSHLKELPAFLCDLPLTQLDLTYCKAVDVQHLTGLTRLQNLSLQVHLRALPIRLDSLSFTIHTLLL
jgi:hypothetical protein